MKKAYVLIILITILFVGCGAEDKTTIEVGNDLDVYYTYTEESEGDVSSTRSKPNTGFQSTIYYSKDLENWYLDKNFTVAATISNFN